jgi:hypothetical protein
VRSPSSAPGRRRHRVDVGKAHHHVDDAGKPALSKQVTKDQWETGAIVARLGRRRNQVRPGVD